jgi:CheY-like chemotaxis protein
VKQLREVPPVEANEAQLGELFLTLLVNAAQAVPEGHADVNEVRVTTCVDEAGAVVVEVMDTGTGITPDALPRIFDPFFTTKGGVAGVGLGLSIAHGIARDLGGSLSVASEPGKGSTFRVSLPAARSYRKSSGRWRTVPPARKRVLVIDDEPLVRAAIAEALAAENEVVHVGAAKEGLALMLAAREPFDVVLCDLMMPVMTGMDLYVEVVRAAPSQAGRIVFMTGGVFTARAKAFLESVSNACLEKPLQIGKLRSVLART